ncbi:MAG: BspA family leucine-rich repeat surface protein [Prevotella sp.]
MRQKLTILMTLVMMMLFPLTIAAENVGYAVFNSSDGTLTFKYGEKTAAGTNETVYDLKTGANAPEWSSKASSITKVIFDESFSDARPTSCYCWFYGCNNLTTIDGIKYLNTSEVTNICLMFSGCSKLTSLDLSGFNTANVEDMSMMFHNCSLLTSLNLSGFNTANVKDISYMFYGCSLLTSLDLSNFNTANVTNMSYMFSGCTGLTSLDVTSFRTPNVTNMSHMFSECSGLTSLDVTKFNTAKVTNMCLMFSECSGLTSLDVTKFNTANVNDMHQMFDGCSGLTSLDLTSFNTANVTLMVSMFDGCTQLTTIYVSDGFSTGKVNNSDDMFKGCTSLVGANPYESSKTDATYANYLTGYFTKLPAVGAGFAYAIFDSDSGTLTFKYGAAKPTGADALNTGIAYPDWNDNPITKVIFDYSFKNARPTSCYKWFCGYYSANLTTIEGIKYLNTSEVMNMNGMFNGCSNLTALDLSNFNTEKVTNMSYMFYNCSNLTSLDLTSFNTENVTDMYAMFENCSNLTALDLTGFNTANVTDISYMFYDCSKLTALTLTSFNTEKVTNMSNMFYDCSLLTALDLTNFNTENVTNMNSMFEDCSLLTSLDLTGFNTAKVTDMSGMFADCSQLATIYASDKFTTGSGTSSELMFTGCTKLVGAISYNSGKTDKTHANYTEGYFKTYYMVNRTKTELYGSDKYNISSLNFTDGDIVTNVPLNVSGGITYTRTMASQWGTLCLPFDVTYDSENGGYKLYSLTSATADALTFTEYENGTIAAGTPVAIKRVAEESQDVTISASDQEVKTTANANPTDESAWRLVGTFRTVDVPDDGYIISKDAFWNVGKLKEEGQNVKRVKVNPYRAYIMPAVENTSASYAARMLSIDFIDNDGETTSIENFDAAPDNSDSETYYDLNGQRITLLRKGVNIVKNGNKTRKVIIK